MSGPVNNPFSSRKKALAFNIQTAPGTPIVLTSADAIDVGNCSYSPKSRTSEDPRYTGTVHRPGDILAGVSWDVTFEWLIHGFSGALPAADAFLPGRVLKAVGFTEQRLAAAVGPEAYSSGTTTAATLGASASSTANFYKGMAVNFAPIGAAPLGLAMIRDYTTGKVATLARTRTLAGTGNYTIPPQLAYTLSTTEPANPASITVWEGDNGGSGRRMNFVDMRPTAFTIEMVTSSRDNSGSYCKITATFSGDLGSEAVEAPPAFSNNIAIPPFLNGQQDIANTQLGGASVTIDLGIGSGYPPNPNQSGGFDPGLVTVTKRKVSYTLNMVRQSVIDFNALAAAQAQWPSQFLWGLATGNYMGLMIDQQRFDYRTPAEGQDFITTTGDAWIDGVDRAIALAFIGY